MRILEEKDIAYAVMGGCILGGGGGGSRKAGEELARQAVSKGEIRLITIDEIEPDKRVLTVSAVGAPSSRNAYASGDDYMKTVELYQKVFDCSVSALMTNECGGNATVNGWLQAAATGIPLLDAACNGRAHPTGVMGSMGLHNDITFVSQQVAIGGDSEFFKHIELTIKGSLFDTSDAVRETAVKAGGLVAVARNDVPASFVKDHGAVGAITQSIELGHQYLDAPNFESSLQNVASFLGGEILARGVVDNFTIECQNGFDIGTVVVRTQQCAIVELSFWNEYMTLDVNHKRHSTFPDLIMTFNCETGEPVTTAEIREGMNIAILTVPREKLLLGEGMRCDDLIEDVETIIGKPML